MGNHSLPSGKNTHTKRQNLHLTFKVLVLPGGCWLEGCGSVGVSSRDDKICHLQAHTLHVLVALNDRPVQIKVRYNTSTLF